MKKQTQPFNIEKTAQYTFVLAVFIFGCYVLKPVLAPLMFSVILALVFLPIVNWLERIGFNQLFSALTTVVIFASLFLVTGIVGIFQLQELGSSYGDLEQVFFKKLNTVLDKLPANVQPPTMREVDDLEKMIPEDLSILGSFFSDALKISGEVLTTATLLPIFVFFILFYRKKIREFLSWIDHKIYSDLQLVMAESKEVVQKYLSGLGLVVLIIATCATLGLWLIGIKYALLLGVLSALLTIIPYVGTFIGALIPVVFAFLTKDSMFYGIAVMALYGLIQIVENNFISPIVLGNSVNVNPFASILALIVMGQFWGIIGMVIAVPLVAIIVILFEHSKKLKPLNILLKNEQ